MAAAKAPAPARERQSTGTLQVFNRPIITFRGSVLGISPQERVANSEARISALLERGGADQVTVQKTDIGNFVKIDSAMDQSGGQIKINCGCSQNYYAYVYPTREYEIFVCKAFWTANTTGTDSKAGTLIHEMSHFNVVAATDDVVYGQTGAKSLAISNPDRAIQNADSHEYFAENTPFQN